MRNTFLGSDQETKILNNKIVYQIKETEVWSLQYWTKYSLIKWLEELATLNKFKLSPFLATLQDSRLRGLNVKCKTWA